MRSVLEELYYGNIRPDSKFYEQDSPFVKAARVKSDSMDKLMASLDDVEKEFFEKYREAQGDIEGITRFDTFTYAIKFGVLLMVEIFMGKGEIINEGGAVTDE